MKRYIKKTAIVFLIISIIMSYINIFAFRAIAEEITETDEIIQSSDDSETDDSEIEADETEETETDEEEIEGSEADKAESEETETENEKVETENEESETDETGTEENENNENVLEESSQMITMFSLARTVSDFSYYYTSDTEAISYCSAAEINDVIANATGDMVIELNNDVTLPETMVFGSVAKYTLDLNDNSMTIVEDLRMIQLNSDAYVTVKNGTITGANAMATGTTGVKRDGAGFYCTNATLTIDNVTVSQCKGRYGGGINTVGSEVIINNSKFTNNTGNSSGAAIYAASNSAKDPETNKTIYIPSTVKITNSVISENEFLSTTSTTGGAIYLYGSTLEAENIKITNNGLNSNVPCAGLYLTTPNAAAPVSAKLKNSLISGNYAARKYSDLAAGISVNAGTVELENTVVRNNTGYHVGGITIKSGASGLKVTEGAIYNNTALNVYEFEQYSHDMYIVQAKNTTEIDVLAADKMVSDEEDKTFTDYFWDHYYGNGEATYEKLTDEINLTTATSYVYHIYNASNAQERIVATVNGQEFTTITEAINSAQDGDTIKLVIGEADNSGSIINEAVTINEEKNITIDLNGKKWSSGNASLIALTINGNANVKITGEGTLKDISYNAGNLELDSAALIDTIYLASGKVIKTTSNFPTEELSKTISIVLTEEDHEKIETEDRILIETTNDFSEDAIKQIKLEDAGTLVIIKSDENGNIIAHTMKGVFLNGESGNDSNDGLTVGTPVKTFEKAKEVLISEGLGFIFVTGTVTVDGDEEWSLPENTSMVRYGEFTNYLVDVQGNLTLNDITMDGYADKVEAKAALIKVETDGSLNINDGTKLINNSHTKINTHYYESGGAIYSNGTINMNGGEISGNTSWYGAGIELWGENASMTMNGGIISNNTIKNLSTSVFGGGAGIAVMNGAILTMNDGEISNNTSTDSRGIAGGILVGNITFTDSTKGSNFVMNGGKVSSNTAVIDGGGIFVQCMSKATINKGEISNNECTGGGLLGGVEGVYGGGGIYVNGGRAGYEDGELYIPNAYISGNIAKGKEGAAIAGCGTSTVYIYPESATIYNNDGNSEIYVDSTLSTGYGNIAKVDISKYAVGGGDNHWNDGTKELTSIELKTLEPETKMIINNDDAENVDINGELSPVKIVGNISKTRGGGIGTNGYVQIGYNDPIYEEITITKTWEDNDNYYGLRPDSIKVHIFANDVEIQIVEITADNDWKYTFNNLDKYDENGDKIEYMIAEEVVPEYETKIDGYNITNICKKQVEDGDNKEEIKDNNNEAKDDIVDTSDNVIISYTTLILAVILLSVSNKSKKHVGKHSK